MYDRAIKTANDAKEFFVFLIERKSLNFHPDTDFGEYVNLETGVPIFDIEETTRYDELMDNCFVVCQSEEVDIYDLSLTVLKVQ